jgi:HEAT repeat protein
MRDNDPTMKKRLRTLLENKQMGQIAELARHRRRTLGLLISLTFDPDPLIGWRAVEAMGAAAESIAQDNPGRVRDHLRQLHWLLSEESGGICWRSPEAMAEIVCRQPTRFSDYVPIIVSLLSEMAEEDLGHFRSGILWAIGRLGPASGQELAGVLHAIRTCLDHPDSQVRGTAAWCLGRVGQGKILSDRRDLLSDQGPVDLYEDGALERTTVGGLVQRAISTGHDSGAES